MNFCDVTDKIAESPFENVKKWGIVTVGDFYKYQAHIEECRYCQNVMDEVLERYNDVPQRPDPTSLN